MQGREYLDLAREIVQGAGERHWRTALGRAYYALMLECRDALFRWGFKLPPRDNVHTFVRLRFSFAADATLKMIGDLLDTLGRWRNRADYDLTQTSTFSSRAFADAKIAGAALGLGMLDAIEGDPARRTAAIAAVRAAFP